MSTLNLDENRATYQIKAFKPGHLQVNEIIFTKSVIITPQQLLENWAPQVVTELTSAALIPIISLRPDILLIGTGSKLVFLAIEIYGDLINHGIGVEVMDTAAACRTYNALSAEDRKVAAALIIK